MPPKSKGTTPARRQPTQTTSKAAKTQARTTAAVTPGKGRTQPKGKNPGSKGKSTAQSKKLAVDNKENSAAVIIQKYSRRFLVRRKLSQLRIEKEEYETLIEKLEKEAWLEMINREREKRERGEIRDADERRAKREEKLRQKKMLEASFDGEFEEIMELLKENDSIQQKSAGGMDPDRLRVRLQKARMCLIDCCDANNNTPLSEASAGRQTDVAEYLITAGADVNSLGAFGRTPLYRAAFAGSPDVVKILLENGADPRIRDNSGCTPADVAAAPEIEEMLHTWDTSLTENMLEKRATEIEQQRHTEGKHQKQEENRLGSKMNEAEKQHHATQMKLRKCYEELRKRTREHDKCYLTSKGDLTLQALTDSQRDVEEATKNETQARATLQQLQQQVKQLREDGEEDPEHGIRRCHIKELNDIVVKDVGNTIRDENRWPLIIDPSNRAVTFLRYCDTNYVNALNAKDMHAESVRKALLGSIRYGKPLVVDMMDANMLPVIEDVLDSVQEDLFRQLITKQLLIGERYLSLVRNDDANDYQVKNFSHSRAEHFKVLFTTRMANPPTPWLEMLLPLKIIITTQQ